MLQYLACDVSSQPHRFSGIGMEFVLRSDVANTMSHWYLLYGNSNDAETARAIEAASEFTRSLK